MAGPYGNIDPDSVLGRAIAANAQKIIDQAAEAQAALKEADEIVKSIGGEGYSAPPTVSYVRDRSLLNEDNTSKEKGIYKENAGPFIFTAARAIDGLNSYKKRKSPSGPTEEQKRQADRAIAAYERAKLAAESLKKKMEYIESLMPQDTSPAWAKTFANAKGGMGDRARNLRNSDRYKQKIADALAAQEAVEKLYEILDPNDNYLNLSFKEQCYIQKNIFNLIKIRNSNNFPKKAGIPFFGDHKNSCLMSGGEPYGFINKLTQNSAVADMFDIPGYVLSNLQPEVRFYKVVLDEKGKDLEEIEITFPATTTRQEIVEAFRNKTSRGYGIGMKSFEWALEGSDPFAAKRMISAKLTIHATTFGELLKDRINSNKQKFKYADLAIKTGTSPLKKEMDPSECNTDSSDMSFDGAYNVNFRLKVVVGYAIPANLNLAAWKRTVYSKAIAACYATYDLIPTIHEFNFEDDGRVAFVINYQAYVQEFFDASYFDIFSDNNANTIASYKDKIEQKMKKTRKSKNQQKSEDSQKDDTNKIRKIKTENLKILLTKLFKQNKMYFYNIPHEELNNAMSSNGVAPFYNSENAIINEEQLTDEIIALQKDITSSDINAAIRTEKKRRLEDIKEQLNSAAPISTDQNLSISSSTHRQVTMFFLYDLIDIILEGIGNSFDAQEAVLKEMEPTRTLESERTIIDLERANLIKARENYRALRILLGPMEVRDPQNNSEYTYISMGEIPISAKYFSEWMAEKMLSKDRRSFTLSSFIESFIKNYVSVFLNDSTCAGVKATQPASFHSTTIVSYGNPDSDFDEISDILRSQNSKIVSQNRRRSPGTPLKSYTDMWCASSKNVDGVSILNVHGSRSEPLAAGNKGVKNQYNWMVYYAARSAPDGVMKGKRQEDSFAGINHYIIGQSSGIVKNIKLEKTSAPMLKEMRYEQEGYDGLLQLREMYNANIDTFLYPSVYPGTVVFVDPRGFAPDTREFTSIEDDLKKDPKHLIDKYELSRYGIGGYYMVTKVQHRIAEGERSTQMNCQWLHAVMGKNVPGSDGSSQVDAQPAQNPIKKCGATEKASINSVCKITLTDNDRDDQVGAQQT